MAFYGGFSLFETLFPILFFLMFGLVFGMIIFSIIKSVSGSFRDSNSPVLTIDAYVVSKRNMVQHERTYYFVTFQYPSGDRGEFHVSPEEFGMLVEGDYGKLSFQGNRYLGFSREIGNAN